MNATRTLGRNVARFSLVAVAGAALAGCEPDSFMARDAVVAYRVPETVAEGTNWFMAAAADLTNVLSQVTGRGIAIYEESALPADAQHVIYLGDTAAAKRRGIDPASLKRMEFRIVADGRDAYIVANTGTASSYGTSEFLERFADFYAVSLNGDDDPIVSNPGMAIPKCDFSKTPAIYVRNIYDKYFQGGVQGDKHRLKWWPESYPKFAAFSRRTRVAGVNAEYEPSDRLSTQTKANHSSYWYVQPDKHFKDHPEYFAYWKSDGKRHAKVSAGQICYTSKGALEVAYKSLVGYIEADRKANPKDYPALYDFTQQDHGGFCECENCEKVYEKYNTVKGDMRTGGATAAQFFFMNALARRIREKYPDVVIRTFAYSTTEALPDGLGESEPNLMFWYCDLFGFSDHLLPIGVGPLNGKRLDLLKKWGRFAKKMELWDYMLTGERWSSGFPEVAVDAIAADAKLFRSMGLRRIFCEHYCADPLWELNQFVYGQLMCDPDKDLEKLVDKYCRLYRRGAPKMREAIDYLRKANVVDPPKSEGQWMGRALSWRNRKAFEAVRDIVQAAWDAEDDAKVRGHIAQTLASLAKELMVFTKGDDDAEAYARARKDYIFYSEYALPRMVCEQKHRDEMRKKIALDVKRTDVSFKDLPKELEGAKGLIQLDYLSFGARIKSAEDSLAESGYAFCQTKIKPGKVVAAGVYDFATKTNALRAPGSGGIRVTPETADGKYHWHKLGSYHVDEGACLWVTPQWTPNWGISQYHKIADGFAPEEDCNWYEIWVSVRFQGPGFIPGSADRDAVWVDRAVLRHVDPPKPRNAGK